MGKLHARVARMLGMRRHAPAVPDTRAASSIRRRFRALGFWIEDRAEPIVGSAWLVLIGAIATLLLWKTAKVISLAAAFGPVIGLIIAITGPSLAVARALKKRRDQRGCEQQIANGIPSAPDALLALEEVESPPDQHPPMREAGAESGGDSAGDGESVGDADGDSAGEST